MGEGCVDRVNNQDVKGKYKKLKKINSITPDLRDSGEVSETEERERGCL